MTSARSKSKGKAKGGRPADRQVPWFPIAVLAMLVLGAIAIVATGGEEDPENGVDTAPVAVRGDPLPDFQGGGEEDPAIGMPAPVLEGTSVEGDPLTIDPAESAPAAVVFLAHWCPHCQAEVTRMQSWLDEQDAPAGVSLHGVSTLVDSSQPNYPPAAWLEREGWSVTTLADDEESSAAGAYGLRGTPFWVFVDGDGQVAMRRAGELEIDELESILQNLAG